MYRVKIKECCNLIDYRGKTPKKSESGYTLITAKNVKNYGFSFDPREYIPKENYESVMVRGIPESGDVLFTTEAPLGNVCRIPHMDEPFAVGQRIVVIRPNSDSLRRDFLEYVLKSRRFRDEMNRRSSGSTVKGIRTKELVEIEIPVPDVRKQRIIAESLDKLKTIVDARQCQLNELDNLIKSRFVEMFGDPVLNTKEWDMRKVIDECECMVPGRDKPKSFTGSIPWITTDDLIVNDITYSSKKGLGLTKEEISTVKRKTLPKGSVLMSCVGNLGICSIAGENLIINQQLHSFQCGEKVSNHYLMHYLGYRTDYMNKHASSTTVLYMNKSVCNSIPLMLPPIELQESFTNFAIHVGKLKVEVQKSLDETQILFDSLMQEYFE